MTDAEKREKVIFAIENCLTTDSVTECKKTECPFISCRESCLEWLLRSALALLKEQEARVMTLEEIKDNIGVPVWVEYADDENWNGYGVPTSDLETCIMIFGANAYCVHNARSVNVSWRCWTSRPTPEQMRETKWEEAENADMR